MNQKNGRVIAAAAVVAAMSIFHASQSAVRAQAARTTADGVFTEEQAKRGGETYSKECSFCHGADMTGGEGPSLTGAEFEMFWKGLPVSDLYSRIRNTMPQSSPGTLTPEQAADVVSWILSNLKAPAGSTELPAKVEELKQITIGAKS